LLLKVAGDVTEDRTWDEVVFTSDHDRSAIARAAARGELVQLAQGIYTSNTTSAPVDIVARNVWMIVAHEMPGAVVVDRSAKGGAAAGGKLTVDFGSRTRSLALPGLTIRPRKGPGPVTADMPWMQGLYMSSTHRQLLDNLDRSRGYATRTLSDREVQDWIEELIVSRGEDYLNRLRDQAREIAPALSRDKAMQRLDKLVSAALVTGQARGISSQRLQARIDGTLYDPRRLEAFERLADHLAAQAPEPLPALPVDAGRRRLLPFYEAYFSNFIEGTEFTLDEAATIVFDGQVPEQRPEDAHDILGTFELVNDELEMRRVPKTADELEELLLARHARVMGGRPGKLPGRYKAAANRAGATEFVAPDLVAGTLRRGFDAGRQLVDPFARAVFVMFVTTEVHPFADGNGRVARIMMNAELATAGQVRIVIPISYRNNYLASLRGATHNGHYAGLTATLAFARRYTAQVDFTSRQTAEADLTRTNALRDAAEAESAGIRLVLPLSVR